MAEPLRRGDEPLASFLGRSTRLFVLTGAGCSTESGIPDYRDAKGGWKPSADGNVRQPTTYQRFVGSAAVRRRYWAGSLAGWERVGAAAPNAAHAALARLEAAGRLHWLVTQNVDGLHQRAGSRRVTDLHGRLDKVLCLGCRTRYPRAPFQRELLARNPGFVAGGAGARPDGDAEVDWSALAGFAVPACMRCGGVLKPDVVFFGEAVPPRRVEEAMARLAEADAMLVAGSSLMVWSGYRFVVRARQRGLPVAALNLGRTRADGELALKVTLPCGAALPAAVDALV
ncbi:MAG TPA: NAD-dependent protein deacetylase [Thermoanaerobaculia bacterium]|jgi:NAD-dependent SIR2 family protein deacetylase|nr:NAD-dependent protein deacetylase [Thermoanaerobaculia bacterium]